MNELDTGNSNRFRLTSAFNVVALSVALLGGPQQNARAQQQPEAKKPPVTVTVQAKSPQPQEAKPAVQTAQQKPKPVLVSAFTPMFSTAEEKERNIFFKQTAQAIREFRALTNHGNVTGPLTVSERNLIRATLNESRADAKKYKIPLEVAASMRFAAQQTGIDPHAYIERLSATSGNLANADPAGLLKGDVFKFNVPNWLQMVKTFGPAHGLGYFADKIHLETINGRTTVEVSDPAMLRQIAAMRDNPRVNALMGAEYMKHEAQMHAADYKGVSFQVDPRLAYEQQALQTLGFDLGIRGTDGIRGPLTVASRAEFMQMSGPLFGQGKTYDQMLQESAGQAIIDSKKWTNKWNNVTPAAAFAVRHAAKVVGVDFGYMMELASAESGFEQSVKAETSSATGMFQFTDDSWMTMLYVHGAKYGLKDIAGHIEVKRDRNDNIISAKIEDPLIAKYALDLRKDPRLNALMGAEFAKENKMILEARLPKQTVNRTDQYLAHFLGPGQAVDFLTQLKKHPEKSADALFPAAAGSNKPVFYNEDGTARSVKEVYEVFQKKFNLGVFDPPAPKTPPAKPPAHKK
ncbi:MAG: hypothetical protein EPN97_14100 [Alphaproteobacteria bacterium]|nr:MAG: hypothetical protein EPN97_14100 [Alphaproteobacteria bacterium]